MVLFCTWRSPRHWFGSTPWVHAWHLEKCSNPCKWTQKGSFWKIIERKHWNSGKLHNLTQSNSWRKGRLVLYKCEEKKFTIKPWRSEERQDKENSEAKWDPNHVCRFLKLVWVYVLLIQNVWILLKPARNSINIRTHC